MFITTGAFSLAKHFRDEENDDSAEKTSACEHVYQRISYGGKNGWCKNSNHMCWMVSG